jgi:hypothetical protein
MQGKGYWGNENYQSIDPGVLSPVEFILFTGVFLEFQLLPDATSILKVEFLGNDPIVAVRFRFSIVWHSVCDLELDFKAEHITHVFFKLGFIKIREGAYAGAIENVLLSYLFNFLIIDTR